MVHLWDSSHLGDDRPVSMTIATEATNRHDSYVRLLDGIAQRSFSLSRLRARSHTVQYRRHRRRLGMTMAMKEKRQVPGDRHLLGSQVGMAGQGTYRSG
jgi:hypothetical protein